MAYILDTDSLIKLNSVGALELVASTYECIIPSGVYYEAVIKAKLYGKPDAEAIDEIVGSHIEQVRVATLDQSVIDNPLGLGDDQVFTLGKRRWLLDLIVTDDRRLTNRSIREIGRLFGSAIGFFPLLARAEIITVPQARQFIEAFNPSTSPGNYRFALSVLEELGDG